MRVERVFVGIFDFDPKLGVGHAPVVAYVAVVPRRIGFMVQVPISRNKPDVFRTERSKSLSPCLTYLR